MINTEETEMKISEDGVLTCPNCGSDYMHQRNVVVFCPWRGHDDENT